jgi:hypothetical protein
LFAADPYKAEDIADLGRDDRLRRLQGDPVNGAWHRSDDLSSGRMVGLLG